MSPDYADQCRWCDPPADIRDTDQAFTFDVFRSILLGKMIAAWGMPTRRRVARGAKDDRIEIYAFEGEGEGGVSRLASIGASQARYKDGGMSGFEFVLPIIHDFGKSSFDEVSSYMLDVIVNQLRHPHKPTIPRIVESGAMGPESWVARGVLLDELRGEPEELGRTLFESGQSVEVCSG